MPASRIFHSDRYKAIEDAILELLNSQPEYLSSHTITSPRAVGDAIQSILCTSFQPLLGELCGEYSSDFARRAMADLAFTDIDGFYYVVDVKTHRLDTSFSMPNLTSVERLVRFYEDDRNYFTLLLVQYAVTGNNIVASRAYFVPIEFLSWNCLAIGSLGWGQVQIANANLIQINEGYSGRQWMLELCEVILNFYPKEIGKIQGRIDYFEKVRKQWAARGEHPDQQ